MTTRTTQRRVWNLFAALLLFAAAPLEVGAACVVNGQRDGGEQCDPQGVGDLGDYRCTDLCFDGGTLRCLANCTFDTSQCCVCGNGRLEKSPAYPCNETCDGTQLDGKTCQTITPPYLEGGTLGCKSTCDEFDTSGCWWCGDGDKEGPEECDGSDFGGPGLDQCTGPWPEHGGPLACSPGGTASNPATQYPNGCRIGRQFCWTCGNGRIDPGTYVRNGQTLQEICDDGGTCDAGSAAGADCTADAQCPGGRCLPVSGDGCSDTCQRECGDGIVHYGESCDDGNQTNNDGCTSCGVDLYHFGGSGEAWDQCTMRWGVRATYAAGAQAAVTTQSGGFTVTCRDNQAPCDFDTVADQCTFLLFPCMNRSALQIGACFPNNIDLLEVVSGTTLEVPGQTAVLEAFEDIFRRIGGATTIVETATARDPNPAISTPSMCGRFTVTVPRPGTTTATRVLRLRATESGPTRTDTDQITFVCQP
jgi:cysteine-rich repeat protein